MAKEEKVVEELVEETTPQAEKTETGDLVPEVTIKEDGTHKIDFDKLVAKPEKGKVAEEVKEVTPVEKTEVKDTPVVEEKVAPEEPTVLEEITEEEVQEKVEDLQEDIVEAIEEQKETESKLLDETQLRAKRNWY